MNFKEGEKKNKANDDQIDSLRYALSKIPFQIEVNLSRVMKEREQAGKKSTKKELTRDGYYAQEGKGFLDEIDEEASFWSEQCD